MVLSMKNWATTDLRNKVLKLFPTKEDIDVSDGNCRGIAAFSRNASILFSVGRILYSHKQLDQDTDLHCNAWAVKKIILEIDDETKRRNVSKSAKDSVECPFCISYSYVNHPHVKKDCQPLMYYK
eukprot:7236750-Ditylum_brightwellii.AAC.1